MGNVVWKILGIKLQRSFSDDARYLELVFLSRSWRKKEYHDQCVMGNGERPLKARAVAAERKWKGLRDMF